jgi:hypothetical protein
LIDNQISINNISEIDQLLPFKRRYLPQVKLSTTTQKVNADIVSAKPFPFTWKQQILPVGLLVGAHEKIALSSISG